MTDKDPKDMTASELLRATASEIEELNYCATSEGVDKFRSALGVKESPVNYNVDLANTISAVADKIDAELAKARRICLDHVANLWAKDNGWPDFREGEDFGAWLDRCFIPRPRFEDGEPVQIGDKAEHPTTGETCTIDCINTFDDSYCIGFSGKPSESLLNGVRLKRPAPEALGADGKPIVEGETVWLDEAHSRCAGSYGFEDGNKYSLCGIERQEMLTVEDAHIEVDGREYVRVCTCGAWCHASWLTHTPPDTQQRIDQDALKSSYGYWGCGSVPCEECPSMIDGKRPCVRYQCEDSCLDAMKLDLLRRQRLLDGVEK